MEGWFLSADYKKAIGYIKLIIVVSIWGGTYHVAKYMIKYADIFTLSFLRFLVASIVLLILLYRRNGREGFASKPKHHWLILFMIGFVGVFLYNMSFFGAESLISCNKVAILFAFTPCLSIILGMIFLRQKLNFLGYLGIIISLLGAISVIMIADTSCDKLFCDNGIFETLSLGEGLALLAALAMAGYNILNRVAAGVSLDPLTVTTFSATFGALLLGITYLFYGGSFNVLYNVPWQFWLALMYMSVIATVLCYKWYSDAIHEVGVAKTAMVHYTKH